MELHLCLNLYIFILFFLLTPGILVTIPPHGSKYVIATVHALVFTLIFHFTHKWVRNHFYGHEKRNK